MAHIIVIGGGPGGAAAASRAAQLGAQVTLIEKDRLGGACVNEACIPLTGMLASVELFDRIRRAGEMGVIVGEPKLDLPAARARVQALSAELREGTEGLLGSFGATIVAGEARLAGPKTVVVNGQTLQADAIILATGGRPSEPPLPAPNLLTPQQALALDQPPASLMVWGGDTVEVELAQYFALQGAQVTIVTAGPNLLADEDYEVGQRLQSILAEQGAQVLANAQVKSISGGQVVVGQRRGDITLQVERVLWAGVVPNPAGLNLAAAGVKVVDGAVVIDERCATNVPGIFAVGDLVGKPMYSYVATVQGLVAAENALGGKRRFETRALPRGVYTIPEIACVGLSETEAEDRGFDVEVANISLATNARAQTLNEAAGGYKVVFDRKYGKLLGVHIVGHRANELIGEAALAIQMEVLADDFAFGLRGHPTLGESILEAGRAFFKQALYIPKW